MVRTRPNHHCAVLFLVCLGLQSICSAGQKVAIHQDVASSMLAIGIKYLVHALEATGNQIVARDPDVRIVFTQFEAGMGPQSFRIQREGQRGVRVVTGIAPTALGGIAYFDRIEFYRELLIQKHWIVLEKQILQHAHTVGRGLNF